MTASWYKSQHVLSCTYTPFETYSGYEFDPSYVKRLFGHELIRILRLRLVLDVLVSIFGELFLADVELFTQRNNVSVRQHYLLGFASAVNFFTVLDAKDPLGMQCVFVFPRPDNLHCPSALRFIEMAHATQVVSLLHRYVCIGEFTCTFGFYSS